MSVVCFLLPNLSLSLAMKERPNLRGSAVVMLQGHGDDALVSAASGAAAATGVLLGMSAAEAQRRSPRATFIPDNAGECLDVVGHLAAIISAKATSFVAFSGTDQLFATFSDANGSEEFPNLSQLQRLASSWCDFEVVLGVGSDEESARLAAQAVACRSRRPSIASSAGQSVSYTASREPLTGTAPLANADPAKRRASVVRLLNRLELLLEGRGESFREVELELDERRFRFHSRQPMTTFAGLLPSLSGAAFDAALADVTGVRVNVGRRGPDVRVRPLAPAGKHALRFERELLRAAS